MTAHPPAGWSEDTLGELIEGFQAGRNLKANGHAAPPGEYGVLKISAVTWGEFNPAENKALLPGDKPKPHETVRAGDLLISRANTSELVGAVVRVEEDHPTLMLPDKILRLVVNEQKVDSDFLKYALRTQAVRKYFEREATGTSHSMRNLSQPKMSATPIQLAPRAQQRGIVEKIETLTAKSRRAKEALDAIPPLLERFRQSVLAAAFRGDLTKDWREQNPDVEPADQLLARIRQERRARWEQVELEKLRAKGKRPANDAWSGKYVELEPVDANGLPELPTGWSWTTIDVLSSHIVDCLHSTPEYVETGHPAIRTADVVRGRLLLDQARCVTPRTYADRIVRLEPEPGDVLYTREGERFGLAALVPRGVKLCLAQRMMHFRVETPVHSAWFMWALNSPDAYKQAVRDVGGSTSPHVNIGSMRKFVVPLPPIAEQVALAEAIESAWRKADAVAVSVADAFVLSGKLDASVLAKAFRGELVGAEI